MHSYKCIKCTSKCLLSFDRDMEYLHFFRKFLCAFCIQYPTLQRKKPVIWFPSPQVSFCSYWTLKTITVCLLFCIWFFLLNTKFSIHTCCCMCQFWFFGLVGVIFNCVTMPHAEYPFCGWTFEWHQFVMIINEANMKFLDIYFCRHMFLFPWITVEESELLDHGVDTWQQLQLFSKIFCIIWCPMRYMCYLL